MKKIRQPRVGMTPSQLRACLIEDLTNDLAFSKANDPPTAAWLEYQQGVEACLAKLREEEK